MRKMKKGMKRILTSVLCATMTLGLCACGGAKDGETTETAETETPASTGGTDEFANVTSLELAKLMGNGFNLGNTMEAADQLRPDNYADHDVTYFETFWGQPVTTQEMISDIKAAGLDTLRIPVAWTNTMHYESGDYTIAPEYLARVKEIVDYAYNEDMFVIINDHWDGDWWGLYGAKDEKKREMAENIYHEMWSQVAEYFKDYDSHLIFEGGNEEIGDRLNDIGNVNIVDGNTLSKDELYAKANEINQTFVDLVRSTGGNNANRFLLIPGYGTDGPQTLDDRWHMPTDSAKDKLLLSIHFYTPWSYCGSTGSSTWGNQKNYDEMNTALKNLTKFTDQGYGIVLGECGVLPTSSGEMKPNWNLWYDNFYANCDLYGYVPLLWDTGNLLNKNTHEWIDPAVPEFLKARSYETQKDMTDEEIAANAQKVMEEAKAAAPETFDEKAKLAGDGKAIAWIMWDSQDWNIVYSVGDTYDPDSKTGGLIANDVEVTGEGEYTVSLDFTGTEAGKSVSTAFSAIGIANAEELFPGYVITIKQVLVNGEEYKIHGRNYTSSDDALCTRTNLYNEWVSADALPEDARTKGGGLTGATPCVFDQKDEQLKDIKTLEITFEYTPGEDGISPNDANSKN